MHRHRSLSIGLLFAVVLGACSGGSGTAATSGTAPTVGPIATTSGGGGGGGGGGVVTGNGTMHIEISGPVSKTDDLAFFPFGSRYDGDAAGVNLTFINEGANTTGAVYAFQGQYLVSYTSEEFVISTASCETRNLSMSGKNGTGEFDCANATIVKADGTLAQNARVTGRFEAHG